MIYNERGSALIISILLLATMSILGIILISSSTTEIQLSGNYRNSQNSFYVADRAIEYAMQSASDGSDVVDLYNDQNTSLPGTPLHRDMIASGQEDLEASVYSATDDRNSITYLGEGELPPGTGDDPQFFKARNYAINTVGVFPVNTPNAARTELRSQYAKKVPK